MQLMFREARTISLFLHGLQRLDELGNWSIEEVARPKANRALRPHTTGDASPGAYQGPGTADSD